MSHKHNPFRSFLHNALLRSNSVIFAIVSAYVQPDCKLRLVCEAKGSKRFNYRDFLFYVSYVECNGTFSKDCHSTLL